jgi:hypothetical protein
MIRWVILKPVTNRKSTIKAEVSLRTNFSQVLVAVLPDVWVKAAEFLS